MPIVQIEVLKGKTADEKKELFAGVHAALVEAFKIPDDDRVQTLVEHEPDNFDVPTQDFTIVRITAFPGRSASAKRALYTAIVRNFRKLGIDDDAMNVVLQEPLLENWGIRGGRAASDVELGFELGV